MWITVDHLVYKPYSENTVLIIQTYESNIEEGFMPTQMEIDSIQTQHNQHKQIPFSFEVTQDMVDALTRAESLDQYYTDIQPVHSSTQIVGSRVYKGKCVICMSSQYTKIKLQCSHVFHRKCIQQWSNWKQTCPTCQEPL